MEKIILIFYIYVGGMNESQIEGLIENLKSNLPEDEPNMLSFWIPIFEGASRVECLNPKLVSNDEYTQARQILERNQMAVDNIIRNLGK